jgi:hypothetical protein
MDLLLLQEDFDIGGETLLLSPCGDRMMVFEQKIDAEDVFDIRIDRHDQEHMAMVMISWDEFIARYEQHLSQGYTRIEEYPSWVIRRSFLKWQLLKI